MRALALKYFRLGLAVVVGQPAAQRLVDPRKFAEGRLHGAAVVAAPPELLAEARREALVALLRDERPDGVAPGRAVVPVAEVLARAARRALADDEDAASLRGLGEEARVGAAAPDDAIGLLS